MSVTVVEGAATTILRTLKEEVTLDIALEEEHDMLRRLLYWDKRVTFLGYLLDHATEIEANISHHLGLANSSNCHLSPLNDWVHGSFNMCVPVHVESWEQQDMKRVMIRFPLPYKVGEEDFPGNAEEKLRCEAATYVWIQQNCPDVPIPRLLAFAFGDNHCVIYQLPSHRATHRLHSSGSSHHWHLCLGTSESFNDVEVGYDGCSPFL